MAEIEKVLCCDGKNDNTATLMAMMNNNNWNNNPFMYLIWLAFFGGNGFGWNRNGADMAQNADLSRQLATLQGTVADNHNNDIALQAINGNRDAMGQLAQTFNTDITAIQTAICGVKAAIEQVAGQVGYSAESVKNAIALGDSNIIQQMQTCCCNIKSAIIDGNYQNQLATERQTNVLGSRIDQLANGIQQGFAQVGFQSQQNTAAIINAQTANTQRILDQLCANTTQQLRDQIAEKDRQLQTANIIAGLKASGCSCGC